MHIVEYKALKNNTRVVLNKYNRTIEFSAVLQLKKLNDVVSHPKLLKKFVACEDCEH